MADRNHDELAAALHGLSSGDPAEPAPHDGVHDDVAEGMGVVNPSVPPVAPAPPPPAARVNRPAAPRPPAPGVAPIPAARPISAPPRPAMPPGAPNVAPAPRTVRPAEPPDGPAEAARRAHERALQEQAAALGAAPPADDDAVAVPAPTVDYLARHVGGGRSAARRESYLHGVEFKRTVIPILLTLGVALPVLGALRYVLGDGSILAEFPAWVSYALFATGAVLLALAVMNMMQVRHQLAARSQGR